MAEDHAHERESRGGRVGHDVDDDDDVECVRGKSMSLK